MEYQLEQNLPALANKVKSVMGVSTQARSPMEVGTEMRSVMYAVPEKTKTMFESRKCLCRATAEMMCNANRD